MIWVKRRFELAEYAPYQVRLAKLMLENPSLHSQFIMVSTVTDVPNVFDYYVGVPSQTFFADFDGFVIVDESDLPKEIDEVKFAGDKAHNDLAGFAFGSVELRRYVRLCTIFTSHSAARSRRSWSRRAQWRW
jgi:hypothetical protein